MHRKSTGCVLHEGVLSYVEEQSSADTSDACSCEGGHTWARRSSTGCIMRQGPHQLALKSSSTALSEAACTGNLHSTGTLPISCADTAETAQLGVCRRPSSQHLLRWKDDLA